MVGVMEGIDGKENANNIENSTQSMTEINSIVRRKCNPKYYFTA